MKLNSINELKDGMWCRLADGKTYTYGDPPDTPSGLQMMGYSIALIDMGAEWYPPIPEGYRLATAEDRGKGGFVKGRRFARTGSDQFYPLNDNQWFEDAEYIVPARQEPEQSVGKVYTVSQGAWRNFIYTDWDFEPGAKVTIALAEDSAHGIKARDTDQTGGENR